MAILCATGLMELYMTRTILSIAIVDMVQVVNAETTLKASSSQPYCLQHQNASIDSSSLNATNEEYNDGGE
ncbi:hypothetical protein Avbf_17060 [Armadillidium vulgare]|nr:hypothetical protein Avbf_17060 [Armadillidium vulgare]